MQRRKDLHWSAAAPIIGEHMVPNNAPAETMWNQTVGEDQPNWITAPECLKSKRESMDETLAKHLFTIHHSKRDGIWQGQSRAPLDASVQTPCQCVIWQASSRNDSLKQRHRGVRAWQRARTYGKRVVLIKAAQLARSTVVACSQLTRETYHLPQRQRQFRN